MLQSSFWIAEYGPVPDVATIQHTIPYAVCNIEIRLEPGYGRSIYLTGKTVKRFSKKAEEAITKFTRPSVAFAVLAACFMLGLSGPAAALAGDPRDGRSGDSSDDRRGSDDDRPAPAVTPAATPAPVVALAVNGAPVNLGSASNFVILSKTGITNVPTSRIVGNIGTSPITGAAITGLSCSEVSGRIYTVNAAGPSCRVIDVSRLSTAVGDMQTAYTDAAGRETTSAATHNVGGGTLSGLTLAPGVYTWGSNVTIPNNITLNGSSNDVWIFQIAGTLNISSGKQVVLAGGAQARNIFWQVSGATTLGTNSRFNGNILGQTNIALQTGAVLNGRALAQTAVTLQKNAVTRPM
ncbi:MAG: repeat-containing protein [Chloroflexi bacterium]|nr:repeat-containing protein [Chloroflexota bacterium]